MLCQRGDVGTLSNQSSVRELYVLLSLYWAAKAKAYSTQSEVANPTLAHCPQHARLARVAVFPSIPVPLTHFHCCCCCVRMCAHVLHSRTPWCRSTLRSRRTRFSTLR